MVLAEIDLLLNRLQEQNVPNKTINDINISTINYIKKYSKQSAPRSLIITKIYSTTYLKERDLITVAFDKGTGICAMKRKTCENKLMDILNLTQFKEIEKSRKNVKEFSLKEEKKIKMF